MPGNFLDCQIWENFFQVSFIYYYKILEYFRYSFAVTHLQYFELTGLIKHFVIHVSSFQGLIMNMLSLSLSVFCVKSVKKLNLLQCEKSLLIRLPIQDYITLFKCIFYLINCYFQNDLKKCYSFLIAWIFSTGFI